MSNNIQDKHPCEINDQSNVTCQRAETKYVATFALKPDFRLSGAIRMKISSWSQFVAQRFQEDTAVRKSSAPSNVDGKTF